MISASCPSCAAPLAFPSGAAVTSVCDGCGSVVVRTGDAVRDQGRIARFQRDLSPIQVGATGRFDGRGFRVMGVLRKARARVRWNEWAIVFDDGARGWIGEGNGQWSVYGSAVPISRPPERPRVGTRLTLDGRSWRVTERAEAAIVAAEGTLPFAVDLGEKSFYLDLREIDGPESATLDFADDPPTLWSGREATLVQLQMEGLRPFAGWSDPALVHFAGPEVNDTRTLRCESCGASNLVRAPGQSLHLACAYCGAVTALDTDDDSLRGELRARGDRPTFLPVLPLGTRGTLRGVEWVVIGAMVRAVREDGMDWTWTEILLHNPYRGFAWLVRDTQDHWSFVEPVRGALPVGDDAVRTLRGQSFQRFQGGSAIVRQVLGEFTWEVETDDRADTIDFVAPPLMLSEERTGDEVSWSVGNWLPHTDIARAFRVDVSPPRGVAPHQPNLPKERNRGGALTRRGAALLVVATVLLALAWLLPDREVLLRQDLAIASGENAWMIPAVTLAAPDTVEIAVDASLLSQPDVVVSLINAESGEVWDWTTWGTSTAASSLGAGSWVGRVALPTTADPADIGGTIRFTLTRDPGYLTPALVLFFFSLLGPIAHAIDVSSFESRRWANSDRN